MKRDDNTSKQIIDNLYKWVLGVVETNIFLNDPVHHFKPFSPILGSMPDV